MTVPQDTDTRTASTVAAVETHNQAIGRRDVDAILATMTADCIFETTFPAPDGERCEGHDAVRNALRLFFESSPHARFDTEELFACGDRAVLRWTYHWQEADGTPGHVRGVDIIRVRDGKVSETLAYVKG